MQKTIGNCFRLSVPALLPFCLAAVLHAQSFSSGSTGADGDLIVNTAGVTIFSATPVGGGTVYNFKTIQIAVGSTLRLSGSVLPAPLYFLAQGAVTIAGTIDLSGQNGQTSTQATRANFTTPGSGGYGGGAGSYSNNAAQPGLGPTGGLVGACSVWSGGGPGGFTGNQFLVPLVGGSGGAGSSSESGGAGGGALLIASSTSITVTGTITANGGSPITVPNTDTTSGGGAGGGIRLVAPAIAGTGTITAVGGLNVNTNVCGGASGLIRLESFQDNFTGSASGTLYLATPVNLFLPASTAQPSIMVTSIGGVAVPPNPTGSFTVPDVALNSSSPLTVNIQATNIPAGTTATVYFTTENFPDQKIVSTPLATTGTPGVMNASATVTLNPGYSLGFITATWTQ